jgi:hypothetical protein
MTETTDTQSLSGDALAQILGPTLAERKESYPKPAEPAPAVEQNSQTSPAVAEVEKPALVEASKQSEPAAPVVNSSGNSQPTDPYATLLNDVLGEQKPAAIQWSDEAKNLFKQTYGVDDPVAFKAEIDQKIAQADLIKKQYEEVAPLKESLDKLPPSMYRALQLAFEGKIEDAQNYIKELPKVAFENKESKDLDDRVLIDTYLPGKIKPEQWAALTDPEADEEIVDAIEGRIAILRDTAGELHDKRRNEAIAQVAQQREAEKQAFENYQNGLATSIASAKNSSLRLFVDDNVVNDMKTGGFLGQFVQQDGVTPTPQATTLYLKALHFDSAVKAADTRGFERGKQEALLEATSRQPTMSRMANRDGGDQPRPTTEQDAINQILLKAQLTI